MANVYPNINAAVRDELPKHKLKERESAIAEVAITMGQTITLVQNAAGRPLANLAGAGLQFWVATCDAAAGALVTYEELGVVKVNGGAAFNSGVNLMADGLGNAITHVNGNWIGGYSRWPCSGLGHQVEMSVYQAYR